MKRRAGIGFLLGCTLVLAAASTEPSLTQQQRVPPPPQKPPPSPARASYAERILLNKDDTEDENDTQQQSNQPSLDSFKIKLPPLSRVPPPPPPRLKNANFPHSDEVSNMEPSSVESNQNQINLPPKDPPKALSKTQLTPPLPPPPPPPPPPPSLSGTDADKTRTSPYEQDSLGRTKAENVVVPTTVHPRETEKSTESKSENFLADGQNTPPIYRRLSDDGRQAGDSSSMEQLQRPLQGDPDRPLETKEGHGTDVFIPSTPPSSRSRNEFTDFRSTLDTPRYQGRRQHSRQTSQRTNQNQAWQGRPPMSGIPISKPDPRQLYQQANMQRREANPPSTWKRLWRRIEGSLDGLADLEHTLGDKAKQIYTSTVDTAAAAVARVPASIKSHETSLPKLNRPRYPQRPRQSSPVQSSQPQTTVLDRVQHKSVSHTAQTSQPSSQLGSRSINWSDVVHKKTRKVISANGGASTPSEGVRMNNPDDMFPTAAEMPSTPSFPSKQDLSNPPLKRAFPATSSQSPMNVPRPGRNEPERIKSFDVSVGKPFSWKSKLGTLISSIPRLRFGSSSLHDYSSTVDAWKVEDDLFDKPRQGLLGIFHREDKEVVPRHSMRRSKYRSALMGKFSPALVSLGEKSKSSRSFSLLSDEDFRECRSIGRSRAYFDIASLLFLLLGAKCLPLFEDGLLRGIVPRHANSETVMSFLSAFLESWSPVLLSAAILATLSSHLALENRGKPRAMSKKNTAVDEARFGGLFLRLFTSELTTTRAVNDYGATALKQFLAKIELVRLRTFLSFVILSVLFLAVSFVRPIYESIASASLQFLAPSELLEWPPKWQLLWTSLQGFVAAVAPVVLSTLKDGVAAVTENPLWFAYEISLLLSLFAVYNLPFMEAKRKIKPAKKDDDDEDDEVLSESYSRFTNKVSALGASSSTRLSLLSHSLEGMLERWHLAQPPDLGQTAHSFPHVVRMFAYYVSSSLLLLCPVITYVRSGVSPRTDNQVIQWHSLFDLCVVLFYVHTVVWSAFKRILAAKTTEFSIRNFLESIKNAIQERSKHLESPAMSLQVQASISPTSGLAVRDLWAAHNTKRAWAVRGTNLECRSGEILLVLGDESAGKTRLLTTLAEILLSPPGLSSSVTRISRGSVTLGGLDVTKWDAPSLQNRVGVLLRDACSTTAMAEVLSGMSLEEILDPYDGLQSVGPSHSPTRGERACISQALHITGLNASLLPRLPSKMTTVVTASEEDLKPSSFRARSVLLSPVEWSKVLLARTLSQSIFRNDSTEHNSSKFDNCLVGSLLLLDDGTSGLSEVDEARLLKNLRQTGAAVVVTSNRWASGRWADKIAVIQDGMIVESGTHSELISRGPQKSIYASNWHAMTSIV